MKQFTIFGFFFAFYLPLFGKVLPPFQQRQETFINYGLPLALIVALIAGVKWLTGPREPARRDPMYWIFVFLAGYCLIWIVKGMVSGLFSTDTLTTLRTKMAGPLYALAAIAVLRSLESKERYSLAIPAILAAAFSVQLFLSSVESLRGIGFGKYEIGWVGQVGLEGRDVLEAVGVNELSALGFKIPLSGQIGQHNGFGNMLVFYNLLFLALLVENPRRWWAWILVGLVAFAVVANTTRIAILSIILADVIILPALTARGRPLLRLLAVSSSIIAVFFVILVTWERLADMSARMDTITMRLQLWQMLSDDAQASLTPLSALFGFSSEALEGMGTLYRHRVLGSVENQFIALLLDAGLVGLAGFILAVIVRPFKEWRFMSAPRQKLIVAFVCGILLCGMTMDMHLHFTSLVVLVIVSDRLLGFQPERQMSVLRRDHSRNAEIAFSWKQHFRARRTLL